MNEALRTALTAKGIDRLDVAAKLQVDPKTVERWLAGRLPHPSTRAALAQLLGVEEEELWPAADEPHARSFGPEIRAVYPHRWAVPRDVWHKHFANAEHEIDILAYNGLFLFEDADMPGLLNSKANNGIRVRILLSNPDSPEVTQRDEDEGIGDSLPASMRKVWTLLKSLDTSDDVEIRLHRATIYNSIFRRDDQILTSPYIYGLPASAAPVLHLRRSSDAALFANYAESFEHTWRNADPTI